MVTKEFEEVVAATEKELENISESARGAFSAEVMASLIFAFADFHGEVALFSCIGNVLSAMTEEEVALVVKGANQARAMRGDRHHHDRKSH